MSRRINQTDSGKAFEYALAKQFRDLVTVEIDDTKSRNIAWKAFNRHSKAEQGLLDQMASAAANFLLCQDNRIQTTELIAMQDDNKGEFGDVRDLVLYMSDGTEIGISAKNRHAALKHSRLSSSIDFGDKWFDLPCGQSYFNSITPLFNDMLCLKNSNTMWRSVENKHERFYIPCLKFFMEEIQRLYCVHGERVAHGMMTYLLGKQDYYKVIKKNGTLSVHPFNMYGTLPWGQQWNLPTRIENIAMVPRSTTKMMLVLDGGWRVTFRIHSAEKYVIPSLKFDVQLQKILTPIPEHEILVHSAPRP